mgnify:CR=1 FL=1
MSRKQGLSLTAAHPTHRDKQLLHKIKADIIRNKPDLIVALVRRLQQVRHVFHITNITFPKRQCMIDSDQNNITVL